jgi:hypothetical protein
VGSVRGGWPPLQEPARQAFGPTRRRLDGSIPLASSNLSSTYINSGQTVGHYQNAAGIHGFLENGGVFTSIDFPGARTTELFAINDRGEIVSFYDGVHGFLFSGGTSASIDVPFSGVTGTVPLGINNRGQIVGFYESAPEPPATVPEHSSLLLLAVGLAGLEWWRRKQHAHFLPATKVPQATCR